MSLAGPNRVAVLLAVSRASCVISWHMLGRIITLLRVVSQPVSRYTQQPGRPPVTIQKLYYDITGAEPRHACAAPPVATQNLCHDTKPHAARAGPCRARGLVVSQPSYAVSWPCPTVSWPCPAWPCAPAVHPVSRCNLLYCEPTQTVNGQ